MAFVSYQKGSITLSGAGPQVYSLATTVNRANCWLIVQFSGEGNDMDTGQCFAEITSAGTQLTVGRNAVLGTYPVVCTYQIIEHTSITTQWFVKTYVSATSLSQTISTVSARAIVVPTGYNTVDLNRGRWTLPRLQITTTTNVQLYTEDSPGTSFDVYFHVVDFGSDLVTSVAYYTVNPTTTNHNHTITSVDTSKSLIVPAGVTVGNYSAMTAEEIATYGITSSTNVNFLSDTQPGGQNYGIQVVEFVNMAITSALLTTTGLSPTIALGSAPTYGGIMLQGPYNRAAVPSSFPEFGDESFAATLSGSTWTLARNVATFQARIYYSTFDFNNLTAGGGGGSVVAQAMQSLRAQGLI